MRLALGLMLLCGVITASADGHVHMMIPSKPSAKKGEEVTITLQFGHPFEHQLFDMAPPEKLQVVAPNGKRTDLTGKLEKVQLKGDKGKKVTGYRLRFTPEERGDYVFVMKSARTFLEEETETVQDTVQVVLHVQAQKGWDNRGTVGALGLTPLTRPYGLRAGMSFSAQAGQPRPGWTGAGAMVEIERYNPAPPAKLPPEEEMTWTAKTDGAGRVTATLPEAGWWGLTVTAEKAEDRFGPMGKKAKEKAKPPDPARPRGTIWVHVNPAPAGK